MSATAGTGATGTVSVALVETSDALPGLLPFQSWDVLGTAEVVWLRDPQRHPSAPHLYAAGLDLTVLEPGRLDRGDLDLTRPGSPDDRRYAKALVAAARRTGRVVYLLGPDDGGLAPALAGMAAEHDVEIELVFLAQQPPGAEVLQLVEVMRRLRDPQDGCPWDLQQDHTTLVRYLVEEAYELIDAIERGHDVDLQEELGDVLLQVVFHAQVARDRGAFGLDDVARDIVAKLRRRHPHVFGDAAGTAPRADMAQAATAEQVQANWDELKAAEKTDREGPFDGVPDALPGLVLLETLQRKAAKRGFAWPDVAGPAAKVREELDEVLAAGDHDQRVAEVGDLLGAVVALARHLDVDPDAAARAAGRRFRSRFEATLELARRRDLDVATLDADTWVALWNASERPE
jgi:MazG family protein